MSWIDYAIVLVYLAAMVMVGLFAQKKASVGIESYFLGNRTLPWWALGASGMASNLDVSGTMINTAFLFALGAAGFFIEIRGGVTLIMAFLMIFMGKWNRRAGVMTMAEWMWFRFGKGREGDLARLMAAVSSLVMVVAMITYFAVGSGKFIGEFLGLPPLFGLSPEFWAAVLMIVLAMIYTVASGLYGVVWTDLFQGLLIFSMIVYVCTLAFKVTLPEQFFTSLPMKDGTFQPFATTRQAWTAVVPPWRLHLPKESAYAIYNLFGVAILFYLFKTTLEGSGGTGNYMLQRYLAAKDDRSCGLLSLFWTFLLAFRWPFIAAMAILGIGLGTQGNPIGDPERVLPAVVNQLVPIGIKGFLVAGLMAAAMSTFDSTVNAGAAYWVKDIYQAYLNPHASPRRLMQHSRWASIAIVVFGLFFALFIRNINEIWGWITMSIGAGLLIPMLLRWYWWRLNGYGFAAGIVAGMVAAVIQKTVFPGVPEYVSFGFATSISLLATIGGTLLTPPTSRATLEAFYRRTRPFGFWGPIRASLSPQILRAIDAENRRDKLAIFLAVPWQVVLFLTLMMVVMKRWDQLVALGALLAVLSAGLYFVWFRHLSTETPNHEA